MWHLIVVFILQTCTPCLRTVKKWFKNATARISLFYPYLGVWYFWQICSCLGQWFPSCCKQWSEALPHFFRYRCKFFMPSFIAVRFCIFCCHFQCCFRGVPVVEVRFRGSLSARPALSNQLHKYRAPPVATPVVLYASSCFSFYNKKTPKQ
jgi:hypothetical protein